jgi:hypothetical protein
MLSNILDKCILILNPSSNKKEKVTQRRIGISGSRKKYNLGESNSDLPFCPSISWNSEKR